MMRFLLAAAIVFMLGMAPAFAQTAGTGWVRRTAPEKTTPAPSGSAGTQRLGGKPQAGKKPKEKLLGPATAPPKGDNAAYIAFDQGQYLTALRLANAAAKKGDATAHTLVGRIHAEGLGVPKNLPLAAQWYARGAQLGDTEATFSYGVLLASGKGVKKDFAQAAAYFERAALKGHSQAHYNLAQLFLLGRGKPENPRRAALHLEYAARKGLVAAMYDLATLYQKGHGVEANALKAAHWMRQAAARGHLAARYDYAVMLLRGRGLNQDRPKAIGYLTAAAMQGLPGAQNRLAHVYAEGVDVRANKVEAAKWRLMAKAGGVKDAKLDRLVAGLPRDQKAKAQAAASALLERFAVGLRK